MARPSATRLLVVRAGASDWEEGGRLHGATDLPLSQGARDVFRSHMGQLRGKKLGSVWCGPDEASIECAGLVAAATGAKARETEALREMNLGLWEGMLLSELEERFPRVCRQWEEDPAAVIVPEGESFCAAQGRIVGEIQRIVARSRSAAPIGLVLRPIALGIVRCWLNSAESCQVWSMSEKGPWAEWYELKGENGKEWEGTAAMGRAALS